MTKYCDRCQRPADQLKRSWFDWSTKLCAKCSLHEKGCPNFARVHVSGLLALQAGFEPAVIGLAPADLEYLDLVAPKWTPRQKQTDEETLDYESENEYAQ